MTRYRVQVAVGFAVGGFIVALGQIFSGVIPVNQLIRVGLFSISGAIGGASLRKGWRPVIGFGLAFGFLGVGMPIRVGISQGCTAPGELMFGEGLYIIFYGIVGAIGFGLAGAIGTAISGLGSRMMLAGAGAFGGAGAIGATVASMIILNGPYTYRGTLLLNSVQLLSVVLVPLLITYALSGALFAVALEHHSSHKRKKLGLCLKCGYDLQGLPKHGHQCPECGTPFDMRRMIETVCEECGKASWFPFEQRGTEQTCPHCRKYVDLPEA